MIESVLEIKLRKARNEIAGLFLSVVQFVSFACFAIPWRALRLSAFEAFDRKSSQRTISKLS